MSFEDFVTIREAVARDEVPYTAGWVKALVRRGTVKGTKIGGRRRGQWLVHLPSLRKYVARMAAVGTQKHTPPAAPPQPQEQERADD